MSWGKVGEWLKENAGTGASLVGSLLTGNVPAAVAAGVSLVSSATGASSAEDALYQLQNNPDTVIKLKELALEENKSIRLHVEVMERLKLEDAQSEHNQTQQTIRNGDNSIDEKIRMVRPTMAKQSWISTICYCLACFGIHAINGHDIFSSYIAMMLSAPAWAYLGLRTGDKITAAIAAAKGSK